MLFYLSLKFPQHGQHHSLVRQHRSNATPHRTLGFSAGRCQIAQGRLDYHEFANLLVYKNWSDFVDKTKPDVTHLFALTTKGKGSFAKARFSENDYFVFGSETKGISDEVRNTIPLQNRIRLPMRENSRSLNLSNSVAILVYEAWRQNGFAGGA
jgi:tRNA (cytidine/uridine-2'-O-)-methyltransferase